MEIIIGYFAFAIVILAAFIFKDCVDFYRDLKSEEEANEREEVTCMAVHRKFVMIDLKKTS